MEEMVSQFSESEVWTVSLVNPLWTQIQHKLPAVRFAKDSEAEAGWPLRFLYFLLKAFGWHSF